MMTRPNFLINEYADFFFVLFCVMFFPLPMREVIPLWSQNLCGTHPMGMTGKRCPGVCYPMKCPIPTNLRILNHMSSKS
jgi:hypothetical protein